jgi:transposase
MATKRVRPWLPAHPTLLPTDISQWLSDDHLVWFILEMIERLDLSCIIARLDTKDPRGTVPYDPRMMVALLVYAYAVGVFSSRRIERATYEDVAFRVLTGDQHPDHDTIAAFRREHLDDFRSVFVQVLRVAAEMGLVKFGVLGLDGVKILANASKHQAMSYDRMRTDVARLDREIAQLLEMAERTDTEEQARFGDGRQMDLPAELRRRQARKAKIETAMAALEAEARQARLTELHEQAARHEERAADADLDASSRKRAATLASKRAEAIAALEEEVEDRADDDHDPDADLPRHKVPHKPDGTPKDRAQRNFTDADSRIMVRDGDHVVQAFNAQAVVANEHQIVVAGGVGNQSPDAEYLEPLADRVVSNLAEAGLQLPDKTPLVADTGYFSESNVAGAERRGFDPYISTERSKHRRYRLPDPTSDPPDEPVGDAASPPPPPPEPPPMTTRDAMRAKLQTEKGARIYALRKTTPEPVFGQILEVRGFRRFMLRGLRKVRGEWDLVTLTHNVLKLWRSGVALPSPAG